MPTGTINKLMNRGFGFIAQASGGPDLFFHYTALEGLRFDQLNIGQSVEFEVEEDPQNPSRLRANHVRPTTQ